MSWGFFLDLDLRVPTAAWQRLRRLTPTNLPGDWWGFNEPELEDRFSGTLCDRMTVAKALDRFADGASCVKSIVDERGTTHIRLCTLLDRSGDTQIAKPFAALFEAAAEEGGTGHLQLVNDGTYSGEGGVRLVLKRGSLSGEQLDDANELADELRLRVYPELADILAPPTRNKPASKKPVKARAAAKAKKPVVARRPAAKKPTAKARAKSKR